MPKTPNWYPESRPKQRAMYANVLAKIENHKAGIPDLTDQRIERITLMCRTYLAVSDWLSLTESTVRTCYAVQRDIERGNKSQPIAPSPVFQPLVLPVGAFKDFVTEFKKEIALLKKQAGYTRAIGEDLMIVAQKAESLNLNEVLPDFKYEAKINFKVLVTGRMKGMKSANFYYRRKGENEYKFVGYLTNLPGELAIQPAQAGVPEVGDIKAIFVENNAEVGQFSASTQLTLS